MEEAPEELAQHERVRNVGDRNLVEDEHLAAEVAGGGAEVAGGGAEGGRWVLSPRGRGGGGKEGGACVSHESS